MPFSHLCLCSFLLALQPTGVPPHDGWVTHSFLHTCRCESLWHGCCWVLLARAQAVAAKEACCCWMSPQITSTGRLLHYLTSWPPQALVQPLVRFCNLHDNQPTSQHASFTVQAGEPGVSQRSQPPRPHEPSSFASLPRRMFHHRQLYMGFDLSQSYTVACITRLQMWCIG